MEATEREIEFLEINDCDVNNLYFARGKQLGVDLPNILKAYYEWLLSKGHIKNTGTY